MNPLRRNLFNAFLSFVLFASLISVSRLGSSPARQSAYIAQVAAARLSGLFGLSCLRADAIRRTPPAALRAVVRALMSATGD